MTVSALANLTTSPVAGLKIGTVAQLLGLHQQTIRGYEKAGLLVPGRTPGQTRIYTAEDIATLQRIKRLCDRGVNLAGVRIIFGLESEPIT